MDEYINVQGTPIGGEWALVLIMIVLASWILFRYLVPENRREWRNIGIVQAFILALYVEMYGFPLTIYLLTNFLSLDIPWVHMRGHLWATLLGYGDFGAMIEMVLGYSLIVCGLALITRGWRLIYRARHKKELVTQGPYHYMRHPQYTGIFLALFGQIVHWPTLPTLILFPIIIWMYVRLARREETRMMDAFGERYRNYMNDVPMFFPRKRQWLRLEGQT